MPVTDATRDALDLSQLQLPPAPKVIRLEVEDFEDHDGVPALRILAVIDDATDIESISGRDVGEMKYVIRKSLRDHGIHLFPYIFIATPSELADDQD